MGNATTFETAHELEEAVAATGNGPSLDAMFLAALGSFVFAGLYFLGTLF